MTDNSNDHAVGENVLEATAHNAEASPHARGSDTTLDVPRTASDANAGGVGMLDLCLPRSSDGDMQTGNPEDEGEDEEGEFAAPPAQGNQKSRSSVSNLTMQEKNRKAQREFRARRKVQISVEKKRVEGIEDENKGLRDRVARLESALAETTGLPIEVVRQRFGNAPAASVQIHAQVQVPNQNLVHPMLGSPPSGPPSGPHQQFLQGYGQSIPEMQMNQVHSNGSVLQGLQMIQGQSNGSGLQGLQMNQGQSNGSGLQGLQGLQMNQINGQASGYQGQAIQGLQGLQGQAIQLSNTFHQQALPRPSYHLQANLISNAALALVQQIAQQQPHELYARFTLQARQLQTDIDQLQSQGIVFNPYNQ